MAKNPKPQQPKVKVKYTEQGDTGTLIFAGIISGEEYNRKLRGRDGMKIYDEMRRGDSTARQALWAVKYPLIGADWFIKAGGDTPKDLEIRDFVQKNLFEILNWRHMLEEILTCVDFGFSLFEMVFEPQEVDGVLRIVLTKLAFRKQTTIWQWQKRDGSPGVTQYTLHGTFEIDENKLLRFTLQQEGDNYEGISMQRSAYKHWFYKEKFYKMEAIKYERQAVGVPYAAYPVGASQSDKDKVEKLLKALRANTEGYLMYPQGWEAGFMDMGAKSTSDVKPGIDHHDLQILKNVFAQFMALGASSTSGSRATSEDHSRFFELGEEALADTITSQFNEVLIKTLVDLNFTTDTYPTLGHGNIGDENMPVVSTAVANFVTAGALNPRPEDENIVRQILGWPELTPEEIDQRKKETEAAKQQMQQGTEVDPETDKPTPKDKAVDPNANESEGKPKPKDKKKDVNASALIAEAEALRHKLSEHLYGSTAAA